MLVYDIVKNINKMLAGEQLVYSKLEPFLDSVIDDINIQLNSCYPTFSECEFPSVLDTSAVSDYFPDRYIRSVVIKGAAYKFYIMDEEGINTAEMFGYDYQDALYYMLRDFIDKVPEEYQDDSTGSLMIDENYPLYSSTAFDIDVWGL